MTNEMAELIRRIAYLDPLAADYIQEQIRNNVDVGSAANVGCLFVWSDTPQGHDYWMDIDIRLYSVPKITLLGNEF